MTTYWGRYIPLMEGYQAYVPNHLPPPFEWDLTLIRALSEADRLLGQLNGLGARLPNPHLFARPFIIREAVLSSRIEGTVSTIDDILIANVGGNVNANIDDLKEVNNYITALNYGIERLKTLPLSCRLLKEIHEKLMTGVRGHNATPGEYRRSQNWLGPSGCTLHTAKYIPAPPEYLLEILAELDKFLHDETIPPLIQIALAHYQFEAIHPFLDGNGRIGRLLITLFLVDRKVLPTPLLYLSAFLEASRQEYYDHLRNVTEKGDWQSWLIYFLNGVARQSEDSLSRASRINDLLDSWREQLADSRAGVPTRLIKGLAANPYLTIRHASDSLNISFTTVQRAVSKLESLGILQEVSGNQRNRLYCAKEILMILEEPPIMKA